MYNIRENRTYTSIRSLLSFKAMSRSCRLLRWMINGFFSKWSARTSWRLGILNRSSVGRTRKLHARSKVKFEVLLNHALMIMLTRCDCIVMVMMFPRDVSMRFAIQSCSDPRSRWVKFNLGWRKAPPKENWRQFAPCKWYLDDAFGILPIFLRSLSCWARRIMLQRHETGRA